ncbi:MAG: hypothetical protein RMK89_13545, partial [Armatimonadota bacterium]|nr:hypothetical protein [Armatimonadota bacterium]MDW8144472.1 hypothetical protein [Armatimonadota bacterium]
MPIFIGALRNLSPTEVGARKIVSDYGLKPVAWFGKRFVNNYGLKPIAWFCDAMGGRGYCRAENFEIHATGFSQWLMT